MVADRENDKAFRNITMSTGCCASSPMIVSLPKSRPRATFGTIGSVRGGGVRVRPNITFGVDAALCVMLYVMVVPLSIATSDCIPSVMPDLGSNVILMLSGVVSIT